MLPCQINKISAKITKTVINFRDVFPKSEKRFWNNNIQNNIRNVITKLD